MFKKLRHKIIIVNMILFGILIFALLGTVYGLAYTHMSLEVNEHIEKALIISRDIDFSMPEEVFQFSTIDSNSAIIFIDVPNKEIIYKTGATNFSKDFLFKVMDDVLKDPRANGRIRIDKRHLAFNLAYAMGDKHIARIVIYEYTILNKSIETLLYILIGSYIISLLSLLFILIVYADKAVRPIEQAFYRQRELVANASHELKTPLTIIDTNIAALKSNKDESIQDNQRWFDNIKVQSQRMTLLINEMLELAKADSMQNNIVLLPMNVTQVLQGVLLSMEAGVFENGLGIDAQIDKDIMIKGDTESVEKLFYIFIDNAIKYTKKGGNIAIKLHQEKKRCIFKIKNTGSGISKEKISKIFERFYRVDESHSQESHHSFGLGLAIAKSIADSLGAIVQTDSQENKYTEFTVVFKLAPPTRFTLFNRINKKNK